MARPRAVHFCCVCGDRCPGFRRRYCSDACFRSEDASKARERRHGECEHRTCVICRREIREPKRSKTCSKKCQTAHDRKSRLERNRRYHQEVRKPGTPGVKQWKDWASDKSDALADKARQRREADPERVRQINRRSRRKHRSAAIQRTNDWKAKNPDRVKDHRRRDYEKNKERFRKNQLLRELRMAAAGQDYRVRDMFELMTRHGTVCAYCGGSTEGPRNRHRDHIVPIFLGGPDTLENSVVACGKCNRDKWKHDPVEWLESRGYAKAFAERFAGAWARLQGWRSSVTSGVFPPRELATIYEAAPAFRRSVRTLRRRIASREIDCIRVGNGPNAAIYLRLTDVERLTGVKLIWDPTTRTYLIPATIDLPDRGTKSERSRTESRALHRRQGRRD